MNYPRYSRTGTESRGHMLLIGVPIFSNPPSPPTLTPPLGRYLIRWAFDFSGRRRWHVQAGGGIHFGSLGLGCRRRGHVDGDMQDKVCGSGREAITSTARWFRSIKRMTHAVINGNTVLVSGTGFEYCTRKAKYSLDFFCGFLFKE